MKLILVPLEKGGEISSLYKIGAAADAIVFRRAPSIFSASLLVMHAALSKKFRTVPTPGRKGVKRRNKKNNTHKYI